MLLEGFDITVLSLSEMFGSQKSMGIIFMDMMCTTTVAYCQFDSFAYFPTAFECLKWIPADFCNRINMARERVRAPHGRWDGNSTLQLGSISQSLCSACSPIGNLRKPLTGC